MSARSVPEWQGKTPDTAAPPRRICAVEGCSKKHDSHGYCSAHAHRFRRHGDPLGGTTARGAAQRFMEEVVIPYQGDGCLAWPFGNNGKGYGTFHVKRRAVSASTYACEKAHGPRPTPQHEAAHSCGKGHLLCCNPRHLRWATTKENHADKLRHGTVMLGEKNNSAKLTADQVRAIREMLGRTPQHEIARRFGVQQMTISKIARGKTWGWLK